MLHYFSLEHIKYKSKCIIQFCNHEYHVLRCININNILRICQTFYIFLCKNVIFHTNVPPHYDLLNFYIVINNLQNAYICDHIRLNHVHNSVPLYVPLQIYICYQHDFNIKRNTYDLSHNYINRYGFLNECKSLCIVCIIINKFGKIL